jgi:hypothetical protein
VVGFEFWSCTSRWILYLTVQIKFSTLSKLFIILIMGIYLKSHESFLQIKANSGWGGWPSLVLPLWASEGQGHVSNNKLLT